MGVEYEWDIYEEFKEQLEDNIPKILTAIENLRSSNNIPYNVNNLFRIFHSFKANADYLSLTPLKILSHKAETVLGCLREDEDVLNDSIIEWIFQIEQQMERWLEEMESSILNLQPIPEYLNEKIKITKTHIPLNKKLKSLSLIYIDNNKNRANKIIPYLNTLTKEAMFINSEYSKNILNDYNIIMINLDEENYKHIKIIKENYPDKALIPIFNNITSDTIKKLLKFNISHSISCKLNKEKLKRELFLITKNFFSSNNLLITNDKINNFIKTLQPLPITIFKITKICDNEEKSINDLIQVVKTDPILTANILKYASSPLFGSSEITIIDNAVSRLGKKIIKALVMSDIHKNLNAIDLNPYEIDEKVFSTVSMSRLSLIIKWYSKVSIGDLAILSTTSLLGNIGQLLISKELLEMGRDEDFIKIYNEFNIKYAEESILNTTTTIVSSQILNYWKLPNEIVDIISYTDNPFEAPQSIKKLCIANHVVYRLIDLRGNILKTIPDDIIELLEKNEFDVKILQTALESI